MKFDDFIKEGKVRKGEKDISLVRSIIKTIGQDLKFLDTIKVNNLSARKLVCNYYDILRSIIEAISMLEGFKVYSHEAYTYYLKELKEEQFSIKFDRFRKIRNKLSYYGKNVSVEEAHSNIEEMKVMIKILREKYLLKI